MTQVCRARPLGPKVILDVVAVGNVGQTFYFIISVIFVVCLLALVKFPRRVHLASKIIYLIW